MAENPTTEPAGKAIRMVRDAEQYPAPHKADVHPAEVDRFKIGGWVPADPLDHDGDGRKGGSKPRKAKEA